MKNMAPLQPFLLFTILTFSAFSVGCAGPLQSVSFGQGAVVQSVASTRNPLVAQYRVATDCPGQVMVEFGPDISYGRTTAWNSTPGGYAQTSILVAGMRASTTYHMRSQIQCASGATESSADLTFATGALPSLTLPALTVTRPNPSSSSPENPGIEMITVTEANYPAFFTDRDANPIWYYDVGQGNYPFTFKLLPNGHIILSITEPTYSLIREVDLAGNQIREMNIFTLQQKLQDAGYDFSPLGFHHDLLPLDNGHLLVLVNCAKSFTNLPGYPGTTAVEGDALVDLDQNWNPVWAWNSFDYIGNGLDINRHLNGLPDWTHSNALLYSPSDGNLLLSMRHQSWVLKINYSNGTGNGNIIWHFGYQGDFALTENNVPNDDPSVWFSFQHFPSLISQTGSETTLAVWDNGDNRVLDTNGDLCSYPGTPSAFPNCYSRATEFQIDEGAMVANLVWADGQQYYGFWGGSINQLPNGNVEFDLNDPIIEPGPDVAAYVQEVTQNSNPQVIWQLDIAGPAVGYRAYRVPSLYNGISWPY